MQKKKSSTGVKDAVGSRVRELKAETQNHNTPWSDTIGGPSQLTKKRGGKGHRSLQTMSSPRGEGRGYGGTSQPRPGRAKDRSDKLHPGCVGGAAGGAILGGHK